MTTMLIEKKLSLGCDIEEVMGYSADNEQGVKNIIHLMGGRDLPTPSRNGEAFTAILLERFIFERAAFLSDDYRGGSWRFNEDGIYVLNSDKTFKISSSFGASHEVSALEFSLIATIMGLNHFLFYQHEKVNPNSVALEFCSYWYHKLCCIAYCSENDLNTNAIFSALD